MPLSLRWTVSLVPTVSYRSGRHRSSHSLDYGYLHPSPSNVHQKTLGLGLWCASGLRCAREGLGNVRDEKEQRRGQNSGFVAIARHLSSLQSSLWRLTTFCAIFLHLSSSCLTCADVFRILQNGQG